MTVNPDGTFTYDYDDSLDLAAGQNGTDQFTYIARDAGGIASNPATVSITIGGADENAAPVVAASGGR